MGYCGNRFIVEVETTFSVKIKELTKNFKRDYPSLIVGNNDSRRMFDRNFDTFKTLPSVYKGQKNADIMLDRNERKDEYVNFAKFTENGKKFIMVEYIVADYHEEEYEYRLEHGMLDDY